MQYGKYAKSLEAGFWLSIDSIIADYTMENGGGQALLDFISEQLLWQYQPYECYGGIGKFRHQFTFDFGTESTVTLLVGFYGSSGKLNPDRVRFDFNPNKTNCPELDSLITFVKYQSKHAKIARYDLAFDVPTARRNLVLVRTDQRKRGFEELSIDNYTEYLGERNKPGRYKLYNKTIEAHLIEDLTRSELTCSGEWTSGEILGRLPLVYEFNKPKFDDLSDMDSAFLTMLTRHPEDAYLLDMLGKKKKKSLLHALEQHSVDLTSIHAHIRADDIGALVSMMTADMISR